MPANALNGLVIFCIGIFALAACPVLLWMHRWWVAHSGLTIGRVVGTKSSIDE